MKREFNARPATEVYLNENGNIVIKQTGSCVVDEEQFVWFEPEQIDTLVDWLSAAKQESLAAKEEESEEEETRE